MNFVVGGGGTGVEAVTIGLAFGKCVDAVFHAAMPTSNTIMPTVRRSRERAAGGAARAGLITVFLFLKCYVFRPGENGIHCRNWRCPNGVRGPAPVIVSCARVDLAFQSMNLRKVPEPYITCLSPIRNVYLRLTVSD
jgi:hypothetical protein